MTDQLPTIELYIAEKYVPSVTIKGAPQLAGTPPNDFRFTLTLEQANALYWHLADVLRRLHGHD